MNDDPDILKILRCTRAAFVFGCLVVIAVLAILVAQREKRSADATASRKLEAGQVITRNDLETDQTRKLIGRFLLEPVEAGKPVNPAMTSEFRLPPHTPNTLAVLVTIPADAGSKSLRQGDLVDIVRGDQALATGAILDFGCRGTDCNVLVGLVGAKPEVATQSFAGAALRPSVPPAGGH